MWGQAQAMSFGGVGLLTYPQLSTVVGCHGGSHHHSNHDFSMDLDWGEEFPLGSVCEGPHGSIFFNTSIWPWWFAPRRAGRGADWGGIPVISGVPWGIISHSKRARGEILRAPSEGGFRGGIGDQVSECAPSDQFSMPIDVE